MTDRLTHDDLLREAVQEVDREADRDLEITEQRRVLADKIREAVTAVYTAHAAADVLAGPRLYDVEFAEGDAADTIAALAAAGRELRNAGRVTDRLPERNVGTDTGPHPIVINRDTETLHCPVCGSADVRETDQDIRWNDLTLNSDGKTITASQQDSHYETTGFICVDCRSDLRLPAGIEITEWE